MKKTDYAPRAAPFDFYLQGQGLVGVEVGVDAGAHAEALLTYCDVARLHLVDPWESAYARGYCEGRLARWRARVRLHQMSSLDAARKFQNERFDFVYLDQVWNDAEIATADLRAWFPLVKPGGILGQRNYVQGAGAPLDRAVDAFTAQHKIKTTYERYLNDIILHA